MTESGSSATRVVWGVGTSRTIRAHWALAELSLDYRTEPIRTRTPDTQSAVFTALNPRQKIPVLCDDGLTITESAAIVTYLAERYGTLDTLHMPVQLSARARYFEWLSLISMELDATSLYVLRRHKYLPKIYGDAPSAVNAAKDYFTRIIDSAVDLLGHDKPYLLGPRFSGVDILLGTCLEWAVDYGLAIPSTFAAYRERVLARPAYALALAANKAP